MKTPRLLQAILSLLLLAWAALPAHATNHDPDDHTLSPYFFVHSSGKGTEQLPLKSTQVDARVTGVIADVVVTQAYENTGTVPIEAEYVFPGSTRAAVYALEMRIGDRRITAEIKEKEEARAVYETAKKEGKSASLLEQERPNVFKMKVAHILPGDHIEVELRYTELLVPENLVYQFVYPTVVGPRYAGNTGERDPKEHQWVASPYFKQGQPSPAAFTFNLEINGGMPLQDVRSTTHKMKTAFNGPELVDLQLDPAEAHPADRDIIVEYRLAGNKVQTGLILHQGEKENFFLAMVQPPVRPQDMEIPARDLVFIIDVSGSMGGFPLDTTRELMKNLLGKLRPIDTFNILFFSGGSFVLSEQSLAATPDNLEKARQAMEQMNAGGGTELLPALQQGLALPRAENISRSFLVITDGYVMVEPEAFDLIRKNLNRANLYAFGIGSSVNRHLIEGMARVGQGEPFIVTEPGEAAATARRFAEYVSRPLLTDIQVALMDFHAYDIEPLRQPDLLAERPLVVFGKWRGNPSGVIRVSGKTGRGLFQQDLSVAEAASTLDHPALAQLWARSRIAQLGDYNNLQKTDDRVKEITRLGLEYHLLTAYTSFVAVDKIVRNPSAGLQNVKQPLPLPKGVSNAAVGEVGTTPEPGEWILLGLASALLALWSWNRRRLNAHSETVA
ncbi:MAG: VIT domain-containing protein [Candidatus Methylacidiphilales bacterium]|nr:VIT domain-containing protein [Candidatus Methylacidiphilales bacterium]